MESWKQYQKKNKDSQRKTQAKWAIALFIALIILWQVARLVVWLLSGGSGIQMTVAGFNRLKWESKQQLNLYINPDLLVGYDLSNKKLTYIKLEQPITPEELSVLSKQTKVIIDGYIIFEHDITDIDALAANVLQDGWRGRLDTNLTRWQILRLWWSLKGGYTAKESPSGRLAETAVEEEGLKITVLNGTDVSGLGNEASAWVLNIGAQVLEVGNAGQEAQHSKIEVLAKRKDLRTIERLEQIFNTKATFNPNEEPQRFDVKVTIGNDFLR